MKFTPIHVSIAQTYIRTKNEKRHIVGKPLPPNYFRGLNEIDVRFNRPKRSLWNWRDTNVVRLTVVEICVHRSMRGMVCVGYEGNQWLWRIRH